MIIIRPAEKKESEEVQTILNHKEIIQWAGGFQFKASLEKMINLNPPSFFSAYSDEKMIGTASIQSRKQKFMIKVNNMGVLPEERGRGVATLLHIARVFQCVLEGRRLIEGVVMVDNNNERKLLEKIGFSLTGTFPNYTKTGKSLNYFHFSFLSHHNLSKTFATLMGLLDELGGHLFLVDSCATEQFWKSNMADYKKYGMEQLHYILTDTKKMILDKSNITIISSEKSKKWGLRK